MAKKKLEEFTDEELQNLTEEQLKELEEKGEIEIPDTSAPPAEEGEQESQPSEEEISGVSEEGEEQPQDSLTAEDIERLKKEAEEYKRKVEELEREKQGILNDLIKTRQKAREPEEEKQEKLPWENISDDDLVTGQQLKQIISYIQQQQEILKQQEEIKTRMLKIEESRKRAESKYSDYQDMIKVFSEMTKENPLLAEAVLADPDPAERAYQIAKAYDLMRNQKKTESIKQKIEKPKAKVISSGKGSSTSRITPEKILQMSDEELEKLSDEEWNELLTE